MSPSWPAGSVVRRTDRSFLKQVAPSLLAVVLPSVLFILHARLFRGWVVDDAGISFAYARNLAQGHGLVSQPGSPPVEGYSDFLWVVLLTPFFLLRLFDPLVTPKALSLLMVLASFVVARRAFRYYGDDDGISTFLILTLLALNTSFVVWCTSGLENPLYVLLLCVLLLKSLQGAESERVTAGGAAFVGLVAAAVAMTRPEGVIYFGVYPLALLIRQSDERGNSRGFDAVGLVAYGLALALCYGGFLLFRLFYFGDLLPNAYYAKGGPTWEGVRDLFTFEPVMIGKLHDLLRSAGGKLGPLLLSGALLLTIYLIAVRRLRARHVVLGLFLSLAALTYLLMPDDWMTEYRFAIAFFMFLYAYLVVVSRDFLRGLRLRRALRVGVASLLAVAFLGGSALLFGSRSIAFAQAPIVPFADVAGYMGRRFNRFAAALGVEDGSLLVPDTGGALYYSTLRVYDLGMLCDKTIARTMGKDQQAFYDYVFEVAKPTFIHVHGTWTLQADLDRDPRFRRDYVAIDEYVDTSVPGWGGLPRYSGDYVRKDMVGDKLEALRELPGARQTGAEAEAGEELRQGAWTAGREGWGPGRLPRSGAAGSGRWGGRRW